MSTVIPRPAEWTPRDAAPFRWTADVPVVAAGDMRAVADHLTGYAAFATRPMVPPPVNQHIAIVQDATVAHDEGYTLDVSEAAVRLSAATPRGAFWGVQTLRQMLPPTPAAAYELLAGRVVDRPRYAWRGMMLDCCRHFFDVPYVKRLIDLLALHKLNTFHWHLTEDQGWRVAIDRYPALTAVGGWRDDAAGRYGGFYTKDQVREVVAYAAARHVTVVPEIEMPGHARAALAAHPELGCTGQRQPVATTWGVFDDVYCAGKERTFDFLTDVLTEVLDLFPGPFVHVGGDECPKTRWKACPDCLARIKAEGLKDEHELQSYFIKRIDRWLAARGRRLIGWDEILEGGLAPGAAVMSWRGTAGGVAAARSGHDVVMSPGSHCYLDHYQSQSPSEPKAIGGFTPLEKAYSFDPTPAELSPADAAHVLGGQGNLWTEYVETEAHADYMLWPRAAALAEAFWTGADRKDWPDFDRRLPPHLRRLDAMGVRYFDAGKVG